MTFGQRKGAEQDGVVCLVAGQDAGKFSLAGRGLEEEPPGFRGLLAARAADIVAAADAGRNLQSLFNLRVILLCDQFIQQPADLPRGACCFAGALLESVKFFEHDHGNVEIVFLEAEDAGGIVHQHVRIEDEDFVLYGFRHGFTR